MMIERCKNLISWVFCFQFPVYYASFIGKEKFFVFFFSPNLVEIIYENRDEIFSIE